MPKCFTKQHALQTTIYKLESRSKKVTNASIVSKKLNLIVGYNNQSYAGRNLADVAEMIGHGL